MTTRSKSKQILTAILAAGVTVSMALISVGLFQVGQKEAGSGQQGTGTELPTPDVAAMDRAWDAGDMDALATLQASARAYFDAGGPPGPSSEGPKDEPDLDRIAEQMRSDDVIDRIDAMASLARDNPERGGRGSAELLRAGLQDPDERVRVHAAEAGLAVATGYRLARQSGLDIRWEWDADEDTRRALVAAIDDPNDEVASSVIVAIRDFYTLDEDSYDAILARYRRGADANLKETVLLLLDGDGCRGASVQSLLESERVDPDPLVRSAAAVATARCGGSDARQQLRAMMALESIEQVRTDIEVALRLLDEGLADLFGSGADSETEPYDDESPRSTASWPTEYPTSVDLRGRARATAEAIASNDPEERDASILPEIEALLEDEDPYVRTMGASALSRIGLSDAASSSGLRAAAKADAGLIYALHAAVGYYPVVDMHTDSDESREMAVQALGILFADDPNPTTEAVLIDQYNVENSRLVRRMIIEAIWQHQYTSDAAEDVLIDATGDYDAELAARARVILDELYELKGQSGILQKGSGEAWAP